jgi:hypothetical protein
MENISRGPTFGDFVTVLMEGSMKDVTMARLPSPPSIKCNVLRESLSEDSQNISCATVKRRGSFVISIECLSRLSSLVINIVGTDDISQLPRLGTGLTEVGWGGEGADQHPPPPPLSCVHSSVCCFAIPAHPPTD